MNITEYKVMSDKKTDNIIFGRNPVAEVLKGERTVERLLVQDGAKASLGKIISLAKNKGIRIEYVSKNELDKLSSGGAHQGVIAKTSNYNYASLEEIIAKTAGEESSIVLLLDEIEDPHNLGAIMRTAECVGAAGIVIPKRRSCGLTETVAKTSAGAIEYMPCAKVGNLVAAMEQLKQQGFWIYALDMDGEGLWDSDITGKVALVIGNEGKGVSRLVRENCDFVISIPMKGKIESLNASNAAAVVMYEIMRRQN